MSRRLRGTAAVLLTGVLGAAALSCGRGDDNSPSASDAPAPPTTSAPAPSTAAGCEEGWLPSDIDQATYTLRGGPDDDHLGYWLGEGDLDGDGRADLIIGGLASPSVYVVLGASLFGRPPGEHAIADVADFTLSLDAGAFGGKDFAVVGSALYISPISGYGPKPTYRVPYAALVAAGSGSHAVEALADTTFTGADPYGHVLVTCDLDADGSEDLVMGSYAVPGVQAMSGAVDLDADGLLMDGGRVSAWGPCADLDGDGKNDDFIAVIQETEGASTNHVVDVWYGPLTKFRAGAALPLGEPDVAIRAGARKPGFGSIVYTSVDMLGDWNGDGHLDLAMHVHGATEWWADVLLFLGEVGFRPAGTTLTRDNAALTVAEDGLVLLGRPLALAGDLNGDGRDDLVLTDHVNGPDEVYARYCPLPPGEYSPAAFAQVTWAATDGDDIRFLRTLLTRGDFDGNGTDDVVIGAPDSTGNRLGAVLVMAKQ